MCSRQSLIKLFILLTSFALSSMIFVNLYINPSKSVLPVEADDPRIFKFLNIDSRHDVFQNVTANFYVFSAYRDLRHPRLIVVIGMAKKSEGIFTYCSLMASSRGNILFSARATQQFIDVDETDDRDVFCPLILQCPFSGLPALRWISVSIQPWTRGPNNLDVITNDKTGESPSLAICASLLTRGTVRSDIALAEWIELYRLLGVSVFYVYTTDRDVRENLATLNFYVTEGIIELVTLQYPSGLNVTKSFVMTDCLYRSMRSYEWIFLSDFNSVLMPLNNMVRLQEVIKKLSQSGGMAFSFPRTILQRQDVTHRQLLVNPTSTSGFLEMPEKAISGSLLKSEAVVSIGSRRPIFIHGQELLTAPPLAVYCQINGYIRDVTASEKGIDGIVKHFVPLIRSRIQRLKQKLGEAMNSGEDGF